MNEVVFWAGLFALMFSLWYLFLLRSKARRERLVATTLRNYLIGLRDFDMQAAMMNAVDLGGMNTAAFTTTYIMMPDVAVIDKMLADLPDRLPFDRVKVLLSFGAARLVANQHPELKNLLDKIESGASVEEVRAIVASMKDERIKLLLLE